MIRNFFRGALLVTMTLPSFASAATFIDFEAFAGMSNSPGALVPIASRLDTQLLSTLGVSFSSDGGFVAVVNHFPADTSATPTPPNIIGGTDLTGQLSYSAALTASFFNPANTTQKATTNFVKVLGDRFPLGSGFATLEAYDIGGMLLGTVTAPDVGPIGTGPVLSFSAAGIHSVRFFGDNRTIGFDNFEFGDLRVTGAVPEPTSWAMMIVGFGFIGSTMRRRRNRALAAF